VVRADAQPLQQPDRHGEVGEQDRHLADVRRRGCVVDVGGAPDPLEPLTVRFIGGAVP
jgi:hypothetical protein